MRIIAILLGLLALLLPFVGIGFADGPMSTPQKLLASGVLLLIALLIVLVRRKPAP
jgi:hypothetical protein